MAALYRNYKSITGTSLWAGVLTASGAFGVACLGPLTKQLLNSSNMSKPIKNGVHLFLFISVEKGFLSNCFQASDGLENWISNLASHDGQCTSKVLPGFTGTFERAPQDGQATTRFDWSLKNCFKRFIVYSVLDILFLLQHLNNMQVSTILSRCFM